MQDASPIMTDDEEAVENTEGQRWNGEEIHCGDSLPMIAEKRKPAFRKFRISRRFAHPSGDGSFGNIKAEYEKLTVDSGRAPGRILRNHLEDQIPNLLRDSTSPNGSRVHSGQGAPIEPKSSLVPLNDRLGNDDDEKLLPIGPDLASDNPKQFVE